MVHTGSSWSRGWKPMFTPITFPPHGHARLWGMLPDTPGNEIDWNLVIQARLCPGRSSCWR